MIITNTAKGPRGIHTTEGYVSVEPGASITADVSDEELQSAQATGYFEFDEGDDLEDMTVAELKALAEAESVDLGDATRKADIQAAIRAARAVEAD